MKKDLDKLMKKMKIDALYGEGRSSQDPTMYYLLNGTNILGHYVKIRDRGPSVVHYPMEREVAVETGLKLISMNEYDIKGIWEKYPDRVKASACLVGTLLNDLKVRGSVAFYGRSDSGIAYNRLRQVPRFAKAVSIHHETGKSILTLARETKDEDEVKRIKRVRDGVVRAFDHLLRTVRGMSTKGDLIMKDRNRHLRIGDLKAMLQIALFEKGCISSRGLAVAQGRDAGVPHNAGRDREAVRLGRTLVFDIFPQELGGGYFFDFTRTVCFGYAPPEVQKVYRTVKDGQDRVIDLLKVGRRTVTIEKSLCEFFERNGHPTFLTDPKTQIGYCHSLGHGLGLDVHESPLFGLTKTTTDRIRPGHVFTVEPGLYYPNRGFGVRLEDVVYVSSTGDIVNLTDYPRTLVVSMRAKPTGRRANK
jgi:Xaa-Pro aminopeptidase